MVLRNRPGWAQWRPALYPHVDFGLTSAPDEPVASERIRPTALPDPTDVIDGRAEVNIEQLFALIHRVNPTGRGRSEREQTAAYATKAKLQSLLVERFGHALVVDQNPGDAPDIVGLHHRLNGKDACHAHLLHLSPRARAWIRLQSDLAEAEAETSAGPSAARVTPRRQPRTPTTLLEAGERALDAFDFDTARARFEEALASARDDVARTMAARALLTVLVDHLWDNEAALALPPPLAADDQVRCWLALAAMRTGDLAAANKFLAGQEGERAHAALCELARAELEHGDAVSCTALLTRIPRDGEHAAAVREIESALEALRAVATAPLEQQLAQLVEARDWGNIAELAREILTHHPQSKLARRALRDLERHDRDRQHSELEHRIERALDTGDATLATALLQQLEAVGHPTAPFRERVRDALAHQRRIETDDLVSRVSGVLDATAIAAFWTAPKDIQAAVRHRCSTRPLAWLAELRPGTATAHCNNAAITIEALVRAEQHLAQHAPESARAALEPHADALPTSSVARKLLVDIRDGCAAVDRQRALDALARAEAASGDPTEVSRLLDGLDEKSLPPDERPRAAAVLQRARDAAHVGERDLLRGGDDQGRGKGRALGEGELGVAGAGRQVDDQDVEGRPSRRRVSIWVTARP